jgi:phosphatidylglycerophosphatase C
MQLMGPFAAQPGAVAFDGDGTLWTGDVADDVISHMHRERLFKADALSDFQAAIRLYEPDAPTEIHAALDVVLALDRAGKLSHRRTCELLASILAGYRPDEFHALAVKILQTVKLTDRLIAETWTVRAAAEKAGHRVMVISASPLAIVDAACEVSGFVGDRAGVRIAVENGLHTSRTLPPTPYADGKCEAIQAITTLPLHAAFGDNRFDADMLRAAKMALAVRPKKALLDVAEQIPGLRLLTE